MIYDLHSHTSFSDGVLSPSELISRAIDKGVECLSITDHDTIDAYSSLPSASGQIRIIPGIELSTQWHGTGIHILGLNFDLDSPSMSEAVSSQTSARTQRAQQISERLEKAGISGAFEGAGRFSKGSYIGRPHFAKYLVECGKVDSINAAFKKYMGDGKVGDVKQFWADLPRVVQWIRDSNGIPVLAHPLKYKLTRTKLKNLLGEFMDAGGQGMEVASGRQLPQQVREMAGLCEHFGLLASCGSDFHMPDTSWAELGSFTRLPANVTPVWDQF